MELQRLTPLPHPDQFSRVQWLLEQMMTGEMQKGTWQELGEKISRLHTTTELIMGAWLSSAKPEWGDRFLLAEAVTKEPKSKLRAYAATFMQLEFSSADLTFSHHQIIADLPSDQQEEWAEKARSENLALGEFRRLVREHLGEAPIPTPDTGPRVAFIPNNWANDFLRWASSQDFSKWPKRNRIELKKVISRVLEACDKLEHCLTA